MTASSLAGAAEVVLPSPADSRMPVVPDRKAGYYYLADWDPSDEYELSCWPGVRGEDDGRVLVPASLVWARPDRFEVVHGADADPARALAERLGRVPERVTGPEGRVTELRPYQREAVAHALQPIGALLGLSVGLGKTLITGVAAQVAGAKRVLVLGRLNTRSAWCGPRSVLWKHLGIDCVPLEGITPRLSQAPREGWRFIHYEILDAWFPLIVGRFRPDVLIYDEVHRLRNRKVRLTTKADALARLGSVRHRFVMSGSLVVNAWRDLWVPLDCAQPGMWGENFHEWGVWYCQPAGSSVWMGDYSYRPIEQLRIGDEVIGWCRGAKGRREFVRAKVEQTFRRTAPVVELVLTSGARVRCTPDHRWARGGWGSSREHEYGRARVGRRLLQVAQPSAPAPVDDPRWKQGYVRGLVDGDGHVRKADRERLAVIRGKTIRFGAAEVAVSMKDREPLDRLAKFAIALGFIRATKRGPYRANDGLFVFRLCSTAARDFCREPYPDYADLPYWRGWLAGMYDAEGSGFWIYQSEAVNQPKHAAIGAALRALGYRARCYRGRGYTGGWRILGGRIELARFIEECRPALLRKCDRELLVAMKGRPDRVTAIRPAGEDWVFALKTSTGNYVAQGYASSNCGGHEGDNGWVYDDHTHEDEFQRRLDCVLMVRSAEEVGLKLPPLTTRVLDVPLEARQREEYDEAARDIRRFLQAREGDVAAQSAAQADRLVQGTRLCAILSRAKIPAAADVLGDALAASATKKVVVFAWYQETLATVAHDLRISTATDDLAVFGPVDGATSGARRAKLAAQFHDHEGPAVFLGSLGACAESINELVCADQVVFMDLYWEIVTIIQALGRLVRDGQKNPVTAWFLRAPGTIEDRQIEVLEEKTVEIETALKDKSARGLIDAVARADQRKSGLDELLDGLLTEPAPS